MRRREVTCPKDEVPSTKHEERRTKYIVFKRIISPARSRMAWRIASAAACGGIVLVVLFGGTSSPFAVIGVALVVAGITLVALYGRNQRGWMLYMAGLLALSIAALLATRAMNHADLNRHWGTTRGVIVAPGNSPTILPTADDILYCFYTVAGRPYAHPVDASSHRAGDSVTVRYAIDEPYVMEVAGSR
ncbi:MAG: hypothetical protein JST22_11370 [Bacteroidetes bacterium]|nr:hypothetical protein [Bacteroidota bacterium]